MQAVRVWGCMCYLFLNDYFILLLNFEFHIFLCTEKRFINMSLCQVVIFQFTAKHREIYIT